MVLQCSLVSGKRLACGDRRRRTGSGSALEACSRRCGIQIHICFTLVYFTLNQQLLEIIGKETLKLPPWPRVLKKITVVGSTRLRDALARSGVRDTPHSAKQRSASGPMQSAATAAAACDIMHGRHARNCTRYTCLRSRLDLIEIGP